MKILLQLTVPEGNRRSLFDKLRTGPVKVSSPSLVHALLRLQAIRELGVSLTTVHIPQSRLNAIARFAMTSKVTAMTRLNTNIRLMSRPISNS